MTDTGVQTRLVDVKGRTIVVKQLKDAQLLLLGRDAKRLDDDKVSATEKLTLAGGILDIFESTIVQAEDRDYVLQLTRQGELELQDFLTFLSAFAEEEKPKPVAVRRGRPRKLS